MIELLFSRLSQEMRVHLIRRFAQFVASTTLPTVAAEASVLCSIPSNIAPAETAKHFTEPVLASIEAELPSLRSAAEGKDGLQISKACCHHSQSYPICMPI